MRRLAVFGALLLAGTRAWAGPLFPDSPFSDKAAGTTSAAFLRLPGGARAEALGGSYAALAGGSEAIFWNPAGLARLESEAKSDVSVSYNALLGSAYASHAAYARPMGRWGSFGAGLLYYSPGSLKGYSPVGDPEGSFTPNDLALQAAYAKGLGVWRLGGGLKLIRSELPGASGMTVAVDLGLQKDRLIDFGEGPVDFGFAIRHLGPPLTMGSGTDPLPFDAQGGLLWHISPRLSALLDGHFPVDDSPYPSLGLEAGRSFSETFRGALRFGFNARNTRGIDGLSGVTFGGGADFRSFRLDYAWIPFGDLGSVNKITLGFTF